MNTVDASYRRVADALRKQLDDTICPRDSSTATFFLINNIFYCPELTARQLFSIAHAARYIAIKIQSLQKQIVRWNISQT